MKRLVRICVPLLVMGVLFLGASCGKDEPNSTPTPSPSPSPTPTPTSKTKGIHFPDANFKAVLTESPNIRKIDANSDGEISITEAESTLTIDVSGKGVKDLTGIEYFKNLTSLTLDNNDLITLEKHIAPLTKLKQLSVQKCNLKGDLLDLSPLVNLQTCTMAKTNSYKAIKVHDQRLAESLNRAETTAVYYAGEKPNYIEFKDIDLENALLKAGADLNLDGKITVAEAKIFSGTVKVSDVSTLEDLKYFDALEGIEVSGTGTKIMKEASFIKLGALKYIVIHNMGLEKIELQELTGLEVLNLSGNFISTITITGANTPKLRDLILRERYLREFKVSGTNIGTVKRINLQETQLSGSLDFTGFTDLEPDQVAVKRQNGAPNVTHILVANSTLAGQLNEAEATDVYSTRRSASENVSVKFNDNAFKFAVALILKKALAVDARNLTNYLRRNPDDPNLNRIIITKVDMENYKESIRLLSRDITDFTGIEHFINASSLEINGANARTIDISKLVGLEKLVLASPFERVTVGKLPKLSDVTISYNASLLDLSGCTKLRRVAINFENLSIGCILVPESLLPSLRDSSTYLKERIKSKCE